jgi:hypothetical protein
MPDDAKKTILSSIPLPGALAVITALAGALLLNYEPLVPRRPVELSTPSVVPGDTHKFDAAPGEDPLRALSRAKLVTPDKEGFNPASEVQVHSPWGFFLELRERLQKLPAANSRVLLMPVLLRPGSDMASTEQRSRARAAVAAGLASSGYVPEHGGSLECCRLSPWPLPPLPAPAPPTADAAGTALAAPSTPAAKSSLDVVFEWFKASSRISAVSDPAYKSIGILWLRGDALGGRPLATVRTALHRLLHGHPRRPGSEQTEELKAQNLEILLLGPHSTDNLAIFVGEAAAKPQWREDQWPGPLRMVSPWATASAEALLRLSGAGVPEKTSQTDPALAAEKRLHELMAQVLDPRQTPPKHPFLRSLATDDHVAEALVDELERRGLTPRKSASGDAHFGDVAIISEYDTSYGRELPLTFMETMTGENVKRKFNQKNSRWHWINFPRGLDGRFSNDTASTSADRSSSAGKGDSKYSPDEVPIGVNQADALRRLAAQLEELDESLTRRGGAGLVAVGVLGGDVYDKLWILRALRPRLPRTQFFTNNLDAWLWQRDELRTTRNLIVGSPYGVTLANPYQMGKLPFRDSYQTSVYAATLAATGALDTAEFAPLSSTAAVRLFEIGHNEPHDLSIFSEKIKLHPQTETRTWWELDERSSQARWIGVILLAAWLGWMIVSWLPGLGLIFGKHRVKPDWRLLLPKVAKSPVMIFVIIVFVFWRIESWWARSPEWKGGEPLFFSSGISAWPAQALRLTAVLLTLYLILKACAMLTDSTRQLRARYFGGELQDDRPPQRRSPLEWLKSMFLFWKTSSVLTTRQGAESIVHPVQLWSEYRLSNSITARITRSLVIATLLFSGACLLLHLLGDTLSPVRGADARRIDWWLDNLSLAALLWLAAFVVDMLWLNRVFIQWFSRGKSDWPQEMLRAHRKSRLHADNLRDFIDLEMVADWTRDVGRLTFFPFYILALLIMARMNRFDAWSWHSAIIVVYSLVVLLVILGAARVRGAAEMLRGKAVAEVRQRYSVLTDDSAASRLLKEINGLSRGAFVPFSEQPVMKALYWLLGALGVGGLWQALAQWL